MRKYISKGGKKKTLLKRNKSKRNKSKKNLRGGSKRYRTNKGRKPRRITRKNMRGGSITALKPVPFVPPGGGYDVNSTTNGLGKGYYYNLASPDIHAPNGTSKTSNDINIYGKPLKGGKIKRKRKMRGGGLIPRDLTYLYRSTTSSIGDLYKGITGQEIKPNTVPNPMYQPEMVKPVRLDSSVPDINDIMNTAQHKAAI